LNTEQLATTKEMSYRLYAFCWPIGCLQWSHLLYGFAAPSRTVCWRFCQATVLATSQEPRTQYWWRPHAINSIEPYSVKTPR